MGINVGTAQSSQELQQALQEMQQSFLQQTHNNDGGSNAQPTTSSQEAASNTELFNTSGPDAGKPSLSDIHQGGYGDCYFLSSIGAMAQKDPNAVKNMIHDNGNGTYTVTLHQKDNGLHDLWGLTGNTYKTVKVTVSAKDIAQNGVSEPGSVAGTVTDKSNGKQVIWPAVMEAAYAKLNDNNQGMKDGYKNIGGGGYPENAMETLTGQDAQSINPGSSSAAKLLMQDFKAGKMITVSTPESDGDQKGAESGKNPYGLVGGHAYTVTNVYMKNGVEYASLNNPWGFDQPSDIPVSQLPKVADDIAVGSVH